MLLQDKTAIIYGAAGAVGSAVAHAFAREGARLFLTGPISLLFKTSPIGSPRPRRLPYIPQRSMPSTP